MTTFYLNHTAKLNKPPAPSHFTLSLLVVCLVLGVVVARWGSHHHMRIETAAVSVLVVDLVGGLSSHAAGNTVVEKISNVVDESKNKIK
jgi:hypothetical protein